MCDARFKITFSCLNDVMELSPSKLCAKAGKNGEGCSAANYLHLPYAAAQMYDSLLRHEYSHITISCMYLV